MGPRFNSGEAHRGESDGLSMQGSSQADLIRVSASRPRKGTFKPDGSSSGLFTGGDAGEEDSHDDMVSATIRMHSNDIALYSVVGICLLISIASFVLFVQFTQEVREIDFALASTSIPLYPREGVCAGDMQPQGPLWQGLLEFQIDVIQNLMHGALLGAAVFVVAIRGDAIWLYFVRNVAFFFTVIACAYLAVDFYNVGHGEGSYSIGPVVWRILYVLLFALASGIAFLAHAKTSRAVRQIATDVDRLLVPSGVNVIFPQTLAQSRAEIMKTSVIHYCGLVLQCSDLIYTAVTVMQWYSLQEECSSGRRLEGTMEEVDAKIGNMDSFEMAYAMAGHKAFLLALVQSAALYPRDRSSAGAAVLAAAWRVLVAFFYVISIWSEWAGTKRDTFSLFYTSLELIAMLPVLVIGATLLQEIKVTDPGQVIIIEDEEQNEDAPRLGDIARLVESEAEQAAMSAGGSDMKFMCTTLSQIASSPRFSFRQRKGAQILFRSSVGLLVGFTLECVLLLRQQFVGTHAAHTTYKWGLHACAIFIACTIMSVETPFIYGRFRVLLAAASPVGSIVAMWQLWVHLDNWSNDSWTVFVACLFISRAACGLMQTRGLFLLHTTEAEKSEPLEVVGAGKVELAASRARSEFALYWIYMPTLLVYVILVGVFGNCLPPFISAMIPGVSCMGSEMDFMLAANWPGMGMYFHYGILVPLFTLDGLSKGLPYYKPSLLIAALFCAHLSFLGFVHFGWDALQTEFWGYISFFDGAQRLLLLTMDFASGYLAYCLYNHWRNRVRTV